MVKILLVRAGSTDFDEQGRIKGTLDIPLSETRAGAGRPADRRAARDDDRPSVRLAVPIGPANGRIAGRRPQAEGQDARRAAESRPRPVARQADRRGSRQSAQGVPPASGPSRDGLPAAGRAGGDAAGTCASLVSRLLRKHRSGTVAIVVPEPMATFVRAALSAGRTGRSVESRVRSRRLANDRHPRKSRR